MQAYWGRTALPVNGAEVTSQMRVSQATDGGLPLRYEVTYAVLVELLGSGQADLSNQERALRAALLVPNQDFVLKTDAGAASSAAILAAQTASGTRVTAISAPEAQGAEFVAQRTLAFQVVAEYHVAGADRAVVAWEEAVQIVGTGGPRRVWRQPLVGPGIRQQVSTHSLVRATQSGRAVGYRARPSAPLPLFPVYEVFEQRAVSRQSPRDLSGGFGGPASYVDYGIAWSYTFERGDGPLVGVPNLPPGVI